MSCALPLLPGLIDERTAAIEALHNATALFTVDDVVDDLLDKLGWPMRGVRLADPSCGDGAFLGRAIARLLAAHPVIDADELLDTIEGWEIHRGATGAARDRVANILTGCGWEPKRATATATRMVRHGDFLTEGPTTGRYDVVAGNPPYLRASLIPRLLRDDYDRIVPRHAQADLLHAFLERCVRVLKRGGTIGLVASDRFLMNAGAALLREDVGAYLGVAHLERLDPATAFYRPKQRRRGTPPRIHPVAIVLREGGALRLTRDPMYPEGDDALAGSLLPELARIRIAPWLGRADIFVVGEERAATLGGADLVPAVGTRDITLDDTFRAPSVYALRTRMAEPVPAVRDHLAVATLRFSDAKRGKPFWLPPEAWDDLPLPVPALVVPRIVRELRIVDLPAGVLPVSHNLTIIAPHDPADLCRLRTALRSSETKAWIAARALRLEGGYLSVTPELLRRLPVTLSE